MSYKTDTSYESLVAVKNEEKAELAKSDNMYNDMVADSDKYYQQQINASKQWANTQTKLQNEKTDFAIEQIEQQKDQAKKDYTKEQSGAYVDWQKQSNEYGANAEQMAAQGMTNTGYSESSQVSMYNTYQNRVMTAREAFTRAVLNYDNAIKEARLQNNSILAEIAYEALQKQLELSLAGFQYKNQLLLQKTSAARDIRKDYTAEYQAVLDQIYKEDALQEEMDQFDETMAYNKARDEANRKLEEAKLAEERRQFNETLAWQKAKAASSGSSGGSGGTVKGGGKTIQKDSEGNYTINKSDMKDSDSPDSGATGNAKKKIKSLSMMQGQMGSKKAIANSIVTYAAHEEVTRAEAEYMLNHFGYDPSKYLK